MGVDSNAYIGPFVVCKNHPEERKATIRSCINKGCSQHGKSSYGQGNFCQSCGSPIGDLEKTYIGVKVERWELFEEIQSIICPIGTEGAQFQELGGGEQIDIWINNCRLIDVGHNFDPRRDSFAFIPEPKDAEKSIQVFKEKCAEGIAKLIEAYGEENVEIKWGFLGWLS